MKLQRQWYKICARTCSGKCFEICLKTRFFHVSGLNILSGFFFILKIVLHCNGFLFGLRLDVLMEYWISFICFKENYFVFADLRRKCFLRTSHSPKSAANLQRGARIRTGSDWIRTGSDCNFFWKLLDRDWVGLRIYFFFIWLFWTYQNRFVKWQCNFAINDKSSAETILPFELFHLCPHITFSSSSNMNIVEW